MHNKFTRLRGKTEIYQDCIINFDQKEAYFISIIQLLITNHRRHQKFR